MRDLDIYERKSHAMFLATDMAVAGMMVVSDFDRDGNTVRSKTAREIYEAFVTCDVLWHQVLNKDGQYLGSFLIIAENGVDLISDYSIGLGHDRIHDALKKIGWVD